MIIKEFVTCAKFKVILIYFFGVFFFFSFVSSGQILLCSSFHIKSLLSQVVFKVTLGGGKRGGLLHFIELAHGVITRPHLDRQDLYSP